jgi:Ca2+-binding EF-hand superfamily protein
MTTTLEQLYNELPKEKNNEIAIERVPNLLIKLNITGKQLTEAQKTFAVDRTSKTVSLQVLQSLVHRLKRDAEANARLKQLLKQNPNAVNDNLIPSNVIRGLISKVSFKMSDEEIDEMINDIVLEENREYASIDNFVDSLMQ